MSRMTRDEAIEKFLELIAHRMMLLDEDNAYWEEADNDMVRYHAMYTIALDIKYGNVKQYGKP